MPTTLLTDTAEGKIAQATGSGAAVNITHIALGDGNGASYDPDHSQTSLRRELARRAIETQHFVDGKTWHVKTEFGPDTPAFSVREMGFFDADGDLVAVWAGHDVVPRQTGSITYRVEHVLSFSQVEEGLVIVEADPDFRVPIEADLSGLHEPDGQFNFALTRSIEDHTVSSMETFEALANQNRARGQSGVLFGRHYGFGGDAAFHRPSAVTFSALGMHNHPDYYMMFGFPEISAIINGYQINTRHIDGQIMNNVGGTYLAVDEALAPAPPPSVLAQPTPEAQIAEMKEYLRAFGAKDATIRDYGPHFDPYLSVLECWLEELSGDDVVDTFSSFRHHLDTLSLTEGNETYAVLNASGIKPRFENVDYKPTIVRIMRRDGKPQFAVLRYRVVSVRLGTYADYPVHQMVSLVDDPAVRQRFNMPYANVEGSRYARFRVNHALGDPSIAARSGPGLLDQIMGKMPGLDGLGGSLFEEFTDTNDNGAAFTQSLMNYQTEDPLNSAFYSRFYSYDLAGAAGRRDYRFGFNDPMMFRAATSMPEVTALPGMGGGHRHSWAIPLELIVASPLGSWNPYDIAITDGSPTGNGQSGGTAYSAAAKNGRWYLTPAEMFDDTVAGDPADTSQVAYMMCGDGQPRIMRASGIYVQTPEIPGVIQARHRWPIAPVHEEGSLIFGHVQAVQQEQRDFNAAVTAKLLALQHTVNNGNGE